jgi:hypothetical protein
MKGKEMVVCLIGGLLGVLGCTAKKMPAGELVGVEFSRQGMMEGYEYFGQVKQDSTGMFVIRAMRDSRTPLFEKQIGVAEIQQFRQIIEEEKMYKYKEVYRPAVQVFDGWSWSFSAEFSDGTIISSHGQNATPRGNGLDRVRSYMEELAQDGIQIEETEE